MSPVHQVKSSGRSRDPDKSHGELISSFDSCPRICHDRHRAGACVCAVGSLGRASFVLVRQSSTPINEAATNLRHLGREAPCRQRYGETETLVRRAASVAKWLTVRRLWIPPSGIRCTVHSGASLMESLDAPPAHS